VPDQVVLLHERTDAMRTGERPLPGVVKPNVVLHVGRVDGGVAAKAAKKEPVGRLGRPAGPDPRPSAPLNDSLGRNNRLTQKSLMHIIAQHVEEKKNRMHHILEIPFKKTIIENRSNVTLVR
jgi:hypothetical protein